MKIPKPILKLYFFQDCPNYSLLKEILHQENLNDFQEIDLENPGENDLQSNLSSPSLVLNQELILGSYLSGNALSCSFLSESQMLEAVKTAKSKMGFP